MTEEERIDDAFAAIAELIGQRLALARRQAVNDDCVSQAAVADKVYTKRSLAELDEADAALAADIDRAISRRIATYYHRRLAELDAKMSR